MPDELKPVQTVFTNADLDIMENLVGLGLVFRASVHGVRDPLFELGAAMCMQSLQGKQREIDAFLDKSKALMKARLERDILRTLNDDTVS